MSLVTQIGAGAPAGTGVSIAASVTGAASAGDLVFAVMAWAVGASSGHSISTCTETNGNTMTIENIANNSGEAGGFVWTIVTTGWSTTTITGTLNTGTPGGRVYFVGKVAAANLAASAFDKYTDGTLQTTTTPSTASGTLAQASELVIAADFQRAGTGTAAFTWGSGWTSDGSETGAGTPASGIFIAEQTSTSTTGVTASGTSANSTDKHELAMIAFKLASSAVSGTAAGPSTSSGTATGTARDHLVSGTAAGNTPALASAAGTITNHLVAGSASGPTTSAGAATGVASTHAVHGIASGATTAPGAAAGTITRHLITGTASGPTTSAGAATGQASAHAIHGTASGATAAPATASGTASTHTTSGAGSGQTVTSGHAIGSEATAADSWLWWWRRRWR